MQVFQKSCLHRKNLIAVFSRPCKPCNFWTLLSSIWNLLEINGSRLLYSVRSSGTIQFELGTKFIVSLFPNIPTDSVCVRMIVLCHCHQHLHFNSPCLIEHQQLHKWIGRGNFLFASKQTSILIDVSLHQDPDSDILCWFHCVCWKVLYFAFYSLCILYICTLIHVFNIYCNICV